MRCNHSLYTHEDEYLVCDFYVHDRYYNYGFSKCVYCACNECHDALFGPFKLYEVDTQAKAYETIVKVIKDKTEQGQTAVDYYEARIAYKNGYLHEKIY